MAGAFVFSGRPDPSWLVDRSDAEHLVALWHRLPPVATISHPRTMLGYRGCWLQRADGMRLVAREGVVSQLSPAGNQALKGRDDRGRAFERGLLATAPPGALPLNCLGFLGGSIT